MDFLKRSVRDKKLVFSIIVLVPLVFVILFGPRLAPNDPLTMNASSALAPLSSQHPPGTDEYGRCVLSRLLVGVRPPMTVALLGTLGAFATELLLGVFVGHLGSKTGGAIMRVVDVILCFPPVLLTMMVVGLWRTGVRNLTVMVAILYTSHFTRTAYSSTIKVREMEFVENEIPIGATSNRMLFDTIFLNIFSPLVIQISLTVSSAIPLESGLSFLGLGIQPPDPSWGQMIGNARNFLSADVMYTVWPSPFLSLTTLATNLMGDTLRDILDPKLRDSF